MADKIYRVKEVCGMTGLPLSTLYAKMLNKEFPRPIKLGRRAVGWKSNEVDNWLNELSKTHV
ncbi:MAG: AlpA family phage regulatory protein [Alphaproteobacteria bacterium]|nr:AlpA family phage regulatory protein [Alphaproteobacteria bacterium]